jgi:hypothetical protein
VRRPEYTFPGGEPKIKDTIASRATFIFWKEPMIWIFLQECQDMSDVRQGHCLRIGEDYARSTGVFDREFSLTVLTCDASCIRGLL